MPEDTYVVCPEFGLGSASHQRGSGDEGLLEAIKRALDLSPTERVLVCRNQEYAPVQETTDVLSPSSSQEVKN